MRIHREVVNPSGHKVNIKSCLREKNKVLRDNLARCFSKSRNNHSRPRGERQIVFVLKGTCIRKERTFNEICKFICPMRNSRSACIYQEDVISHFSTVKNSGRFANEITHRVVFSGLTINECSSRRVPRSDEQLHVAFPARTCITNDVLNNAACRIRERKSRVFIVRNPRLLDSQPRVPRIAVRRVRFIRAFGLNHVDRWCSSLALLDSFDNHARATKSTEFEFHSREGSLPSEFLLLISINAMFPIYYVRVEQNFIYSQRYSYNIYKIYKNAC